MSRVSIISSPSPEPPHLDFHKKDRETSTMPDLNSTTVYVDIMTIVSANDSSMSSLGVTLVETVTNTSSNTSGCKTAVECFSHAYRVSLGDS